MVFITFYIEFREKKNDFTIENLLQNKKVALSPEFNDLILLFQHKYMFHIIKYTAFKK